MHSGIYRVESSARKGQAACVETSSALSTFAALYYLGLNQLNILPPTPLPSTFSLYHTILTGLPSTEPPFPQTLYLYPVCTSVSGTYRLALFTSIQSLLQCIIGHSVNLYSTRPTSCAAICASASNTYPRFNLYCNISHGTQSIATPPPPPVPPHQRTPSSHLLDFYL